MASASCGEGGGHGGVDLERLLKLRLVVARFGEMDVARWWNTDGMLGRHGELALRRGFPTTQHFAQARVVLAVARARCDEVVEAAGAITLFHLPPEIEECFEDRWPRWCAEAASWRQTFDRLAALRTVDSDARELLAHLVDLAGAEALQADDLNDMRVSGDGRSVADGASTRVDDRALARLAAGFSLGASGRLTVPYVVLES